jgi:hypothetical protein
MIDDTVYDSYFLGFPLFSFQNFTNFMSKTTLHTVTMPPLTPLSINEQTYIKGGMAATEEEKRAKIKK